MLTFLESQANYHQCGSIWFEPTQVVGTNPAWADASAGLDYMRMEQVDSTTCQQMATIQAQTVRFQHHGGLCITMTFRVNSFASSQTLFEAFDYVTGRNIRIRFHAACNCMLLELSLSSAVMWSTYTAPGVIVEGSFTTLTFRIIPAMNVLDIWKQATLVTWDGLSVHPQVCLYPSASASQHGGHGRSRCLGRDAWCTVVGVTHLNSVATLQWAGDVSGLELPDTLFADIIIGGFDSSCTSWDLKHLGLFDFPMSVADMQALGECLFSDAASAGTLTPCDATIQSMLRAC